MTSGGPVAAVATVPLADAVAAFAHLRDDLASHGIDLEAERDGLALFRHESCAITLERHDGSLVVRLDAPTANALFFLKEAAARHIVELEPAAAERIRWSDSDAAGGTPANLHELTVLGRREVAPGLLRVTFACGSLDRLADDGLHVKLLLPPSRSRPPVWPRTTRSGIPRWPGGRDRLAIRFYTLRAIRSDVGEIDIDIVLHQDGAVSRWAGAAEPGAPAAMLGPGGGGVPSERRGLLLAGDMTAAPAIARILEAAGPGADGVVVIRWPQGHDVRDYLPPTPLEIRVLPLDGDDEAFAAAVRLAAVGQATRFAWFAGEQRTAHALRAFFKRSLGLEKGRQLSVAYWKAGRIMDAEVTAD